MSGAGAILVVDGHPLNPGDLDWSPLRALGELTVHPRTPPGALIERCAGAPIILTNKVRFDAATLAALPALRYLGVTATGFDGIDVAAARARGVAVTNVPGYATESVVQLVVALLLHHAARVAEHAALVRAGEWQACPDFSFVRAPLTELHGQTLGVVGLGAIGARVAQVAAALGMRVAADAAQRGRPAVPGVPVEWLPREALFARADAITLHCPLLPATRALVDAALLARMKPTALLINTGRGALIDEPALAAALHAGALGGAALDVLSVEPPPPDHPLIGAPRCTITPHLGWASPAARQRLLDQVVANLGAWLEGRAVNRVER